MTGTKTTTLNGESGITYYFDLTPWGRPFPPVGAVYTVLNRNPILGSYTVLYIGQTSNLNVRFNHHYGQDCFDRPHKTHVGIHVEPSEAARRQKVSDLIGNYKPVCNEY